LIKETIASLFYSSEFSRLKHEIIKVRALNY